MYNPCMHETDIATIATALADIDRPLLAARLRVGRRRKYPNAVAFVNALAELDSARKAKSARAYQSHEAGSRKPELHDLALYGELLDLPVSFFVFGGYEGISDDDIAFEAQAIRRRMGAPNGVLTPPSRENRNPAGKSATSVVGVNQVLRQIETTTVHNQGVRFIPVLSTGEIENFLSGRGVPAMQGRTLPVPQSIQVGEHSYSYQIPEHDLSMVSREGMSLAPGTFIVADPEAPILPGKLVFVALDDDEPVVRIYRAARPYKPGIPFTLEAFAQAYDPITVSQTSNRVRFLHRIIGHFNFTL